MSTVIELGLGLGFHFFILSFIDYQLFLFIFKLSDIFLLRYH